MLQGCRHTGFRRVLAALIALAAPEAFASEIDIRTASALGSSGNAADYVLSIDDCRDLAEVSVPATGKRFLPTDAARDIDSSVACSFSFRLEGTDVLQPAVKVVFADGRIQDYSETFQQENVAPQLELAQLAIENQDGNQYLVASFDAQDDIDLSYLSLSLTGLRASDLRAAGGVVSQAERRAFLRMPEALRVFPKVDGQQRYTLRQRLDAPLSAEEVARNALVMVQAVAVDASGNQSSFSDIRFIGDSVEEAARSIAVHPDRLVFSDALQSARLIPEVDFEFRGPTPWLAWATASATALPIRTRSGSAPKALSIHYKRPPPRRSLFM